ncbi:uncharacterized protein LOC128234066 isoform X2 [Mya arenaria]|uniref:uncharacterized protein LOC128234066 isoform X2 n=1 Tax=Mya arenaria TaxID=6604 RepID=UPI0022E855A4|nr:uncharacterized protein LOC128234066 isoform X2 [Mya arenaria]
MEQYVGFMFLSLLQLALHCGCSDVALSTDSQFVKENSSLTFTCTTLNDVNFADFFNNQLNVASIKYHNKTCVSDIIKDNLSGCSCLNLTTYTCTTNPLNRTNHNDIWSCVSTSFNSTGTKSKNNVSIDVRVPIANVIISSEQTNSMTVKEDDVLKLTCEASNSLPAANISWYLDNKTHSVHADDRLLNASKTEDIRNVDRTISVKSTLTHTVSREENGMVVYCNASNGENHKVSSKTIRLNVQYHTGTPSIKFVTENITITTSSISVMRNDEIRIACIADGNPPPTYTWSTGHKEPIITKAFDSDSNLTYPPYILALWVNTTCIQNYSLKQKCLQVIEHDRVRVECVAAGNPEPTCQWTSHSQSCTLEISKVSKEHAGTYVCHTYNTMNTSYGSSVVGRNVSSFHLDILYPPNITNLNRYVEVIEGVNFNLTCEAEPGNSNVTSYYWTSTNLPGMNTSDQYLIIQNISRTNEGVFTCFAQNIMQRTGCTEITGSDVKNVTIDVQYKASIMTFTAMNTTRTTVQHGDEVNFYCEVDSDPPALISILSANGSIIKHIHGKNQLNYTKKSSCLIDIGPFTCLSANKHNSKQPDRRNITVDVKCSPLYRPNYFPKHTFKTRPGSKVELLFSVFSNPPPTYFTWTNVSNNMQIPIVSTASDRVIINSTDKMSTALIITSVASWDSGNYSVRVENEIGYKIETFYIIVDVQSTIANTPQNDKRNGSKYIIAIVGSVCGIAVVVLLLRLWWLKRSKGTPIHDNNTLQLLRDTRHDSGRMETIVDNVLPINDETPEYEEEKHIYANIQIKDAFGGKSLTIKTLRYTLRQLKVDPSPLFKEFYTLQIGLKYDTKDALKPRNVSKNRYRSVYPYDASRVVLPFVRGDPDSDFINASYIDGYSKPRKYIAAQGPLENTISDTWRMIHLEDIKIIVMVTNLIETCKKKCSKYWPDERATYGKYNVKLDHVEQYADFAVRHFTYSMEGTRFKRQLVQFHYTSWPDKNVPTTALSLVQFWRKVRQSEFVEKTPWMVHCSAGVGRTGTFIALDYLYDQGKVDEKLNFPETVNVLREQRVSLVQTKEQYLYLHEAISELLDPIGLIFTSKNSMRFQSTVTDDRKLNKEFEAITDAVVNVKTVENEKDFNRMPDGQLPENKCKSIDMNVIPDDMFRPLISSGNDFINAVYIPTYREGQKYIVTQFPLQNTTVDFVRLLWDHNIRDVVLLDQDDDKRHCYWSENKSPLCFGPFVISPLSVDKAKNCISRRIGISLAEKRQSKQTVVHQFTAWPGYVNRCERTTLTDFLQMVSRIAGPVVVQCHDGYSRSGLFAALLCIVDRIKTDNEVAIAETVRLVKYRREAAVTDVEQYQFCHEVVFEYLKNREEKVEDSENQEYVNMTFPKFL